jgi:hypothetical protein
MKRYQELGKHLDQLLDGLHAVRITVAGYLPLSVSARLASRRGSALGRRFQNLNRHRLDPHVTGSLTLQHLDERRDADMIAIVRQYFHHVWMTGSQHFNGDDPRLIFDEGSGSTIEQTFCGSRSTIRAIKWGEHLEVLYHPLDGRGMLLVGEGLWREQGLNQNALWVTGTDAADTE